MSGAPRLLHFVLVLLLASLLSFSLVELLPGDPAVAILGDQASPEQVQALREQLGLNQPLHRRYTQWLGRTLTGDLGRSHRTGEPVLKTLAQRLPVSVQLMLLAQLMALVMAVPLALLAAHRRHQWPDRLVSNLALLGLSIPTYVYAIGLISVFALGLGWLPASGYRNEQYSTLQVLALPALALALAETPVYLRVLRHDLLATLGMAHTQTLRANGLSQHRLLFKYALRPSAFTLITLVALNAGNLIAGAIIIESIFALPGMGRLLIEALYTRDIMLIQGAVVVAAITFVVLNLLADILSERLDPRRHGNAL